MKHKPRHSYHKIREEDYSMFSNGKFNPNCPRGYNFMLGFSDRQRIELKKHLFTLEFGKQ
jgi:hypothetical protein